MSKELRLIEEYTPLVLRIAGGFQRKLPQHVLREDLIAAGMGGLWDAIHRYPNGGDENFEWYVRVRIRGAIIDELRLQDWLPRRARASATSSNTLPPSIVHMEALSEWEQERCLARNPGIEEALDLKRQTQRLLHLATFLPAREYLIFVEYYINGKMLSELAKELHISAPRVSQLHTQLIERLRCLTKEEVHDDRAVAGNPPESTRRRRVRVPRRQ